MIEILRVFAWITRDKTVLGLIVWQVPLVSVWVFRSSLHVEGVLANYLAALASRLLGIVTNWNHGFLLPLAILLISGDASPYIGIG